MSLTDAVLHWHHASTASTAVDRWLVRQLYRQVAPAPIRFVLWDGAWSGAAEPTATITIRDRTTLAGVSVHPDLYFGEGYMRGTLEVDADDLGDALTVLYEGLRAHRAPAARPARRWRRGSAPSARRSWANVHHHYDLGNDFYRRWLDDGMLYTCAYYDRPTQTLEEAQRAKMELVCRKLALRPGDRVVEAGCGWGALARYMAARHGVRVRAYNLSGEQVAYARERSTRDGLADRVEFVQDDYRTIEGTYDVFVSIGMLEHVGLDHYDTLGALMQRVLAPGGRGLLHFIGRSHAAPLNAWIRRRIFPGAYPPTLSEVSGRVLEPHGFTVTDVENLRPHYARTLAAWRERFEAAAGDIERRFDARFVRAWRLYLAGSEASFRAGSVELFQVAFARSDAPVPWSRAALHATPLVD
ncbi:MAG: cyclopropane-fatty-acyl-phospholipid synthase family protein [Vicinamibacterales bacterium]